ncbi:hypothetical protein OEZ86_009161 [Tetradesmus obliquus]|nr:hypothetical protein OEZ86_009161 [Tetradesmus obliquus]
MADQEDSVWAEAVISEQEFTAAASQLEEWSTARDFLALVANGCRPEVVFVTEGYHKQQSLALNFQLPELERMADAEDLPEPPNLHWSRSANMLNPGLLLERELSGGCNASCMQRPARLPHAQEQQGKAERFGVVERCKLLDVQYISKQYLPQAEDDNPFGEHNVPADQRVALSIRVTLQRLAAVFDRGMAEWSSLTAKDRFVMLWDGRPCLGFVEGYRRRKLQDSFWGSPWRSITIDWVDNPVDRENDPEDWGYGNPWEMVREACSGSSKVLNAPWTPEGAAAARADALADAAKQVKAAKKRKRNTWGRAEGDFYYEAEDDEAAEISDTSFFFDDDPEDFIIHSSSRRAAARSSSARGSGRPRSSGGARAPRQRRSDSAAAGGGTAYGRQRGGIRTAYLSKQQLKKMQTAQQRGAAAQPPAAAAAAAGGGVPCDGLLGKLQQLLQRKDPRVSPALAAAVAEAEQAAELYKKDEVSLACPAHCCHGCGLNGKHEFLVWCCCCWDGVQQPRQSRQQQQQGDTGERERPGRQGWDWQVLVNGLPYPVGQSKEGLELQAGDELTVQGVRLKLVAQQAA